MWVTARTNINPSGKNRMLCEVQFTEKKEVGSPGRILQPVGYHPKVLKIQVPHLVSLARKWESFFLL